jgi:FtsK/SpoIIIE family
MSSVPRLVLELLVDQQPIPLPVSLEASGDAKVSELVAALAQRAGVAASHLRIWNGLALLESDQTLGQSQIVKGEHVWLSSGELPDGVSLAPKINCGEEFRAVFHNGSQLGAAFPLVRGASCRMRLEAGFWLLTHDSSFDVQLVTTELGTLRIEARPGSSCTVGDTGEALVSEVLEGTEFSLFAGGTRYTLSFVDAVEHESTRLSRGLVSYRATPREDISRLPPPVKIQLAPHPSTTVPRMKWGAVVMQAAPMLSLMLVLALVLNSPVILVSGLVTIGMVGYQFYQHLQELKTYNAGLDDWEKRATVAGGRVRAAAELETLELRTRHPRLDLLVNEAQHHSGHLWQRVATDDDFLDVYLGHGVRTSEWSVSYEGHREIDADWERYFESVQRVPETPIVHRLKLDHLCIFGETARAMSYVNSLLARLMITHSPLYLGVAAFVPTALMHYLQWSHWIPHTQVARVGWAGPSLLGGRQHVSQALDDNRELFTDLSKSNRHLILVVHEGSGVPVGELNSAIEASEGNLHVIWVSGSRQTVPRFVPTRVELSATAGVIQPSTDLATEPSMEGLVLERLGKALYHLVDEAAVDRRSSLPTSISIGEIVDPHTVLPGDSSESLLARFLVDSRGVAPLDLVGDGPHMLVAGMTGAGKSEFLRSLILALAVDYSPNELALLLVDYKGGASLGDLDRLPHSIGIVTNLSELDVDRFIKFLKRELERRQEILAPYGGEYSKYRADGNQGLPRLLIVIDEFQGFVQTGESRGSEATRQSAVLSIAARGRSAGVHMVIATQHPTRDVVSPGVQANVGIKACLRTADSDGSSNVLGRGDAASIPQRLKGRLFLASDGSGLRALQCAHTRGRTLDGRSTTSPVTFADDSMRVANRRTDAEYVLDALETSLHHLEDQT